MSALEVAVRIVVDLLVRGRFDTAERLTRGQRLSAEQLRKAVADYGRSLVVPPDEWWNLVDVTPIDVGEAAAFHVAAPLWTAEEGRSDLTCELLLRESASQTYETEILDLHVL